MALDLSAITKQISDNSSYIEHNETLFNIYEGELLPYILNDLSKQFSAQSFANISYRLNPTNILIKIIDRLSTIYQQPVTRQVVGSDADTDAELLDWYETELSINQKMNVANEFYSLFKSTLLQPYLSADMKPRVRAIPSHRFWVSSTDPIEPTRPTAVTLFMGKDEYHVYNKDSIVIVNESGKIRGDLMAANELDGTNPFGALPFVYLNRSENLLQPKADTSVLALTKIIPILLSDLNYIAMFSAFGLTYVSGASTQNLTFAPNAIWEFTPVDPDQKIEIGSIKNEGDIAQMIELINFELATWLESIGVKPGGGQAMAAGNSESGIAKMIDEADTSEMRKRSVSTFQAAESELWNLIMHKMHPVWSKNAQFGNKAVFAPKASVNTIFAEQVPLLRRGEIVDNISKEMNAGFISKRSAMKKLNPLWSDKEIDAELAEIDAENTIEIEPVITQDD